MKLSHFSLKEYLLSERVEKDFKITGDTAHVKISEISVAYLLQFDKFTPLTEAILQSSPLAQYAAEHWVDHATFKRKDYGTFNGIDPGPLKLILQLFTPESIAFTNWTQINNIHGRNWDFSRAPVCLPLYYASLGGLKQVITHLLENGADVNAQGGQYGNALQAASLRGFGEIVELLIDKGAKVDAQGGEYGNALQAASLNGDEAIVKLLIKKGGHIFAQDDMTKALKAASTHGHRRIVRLLEEAGADNEQAG